MRYYLKCCSCGTTMNRTHKTCRNCYERFLNGIRYRHCMNCLRPFKRPSIYGFCYDCYRKAADNYVESE